MAGPESPFTEAQMKEIILQHSKLGGPTRSPDLSPLDFWYWNACEVELRSHPPSSMAELRATINSLAERMSSAEIRKAVNNVSKRAKACIAVSGDNFEYLLKKARRDVEE